MQPLRLIHRERQILPPILEPHGQLIQRLIQPLQLSCIRALKGPIQPLRRDIGSRNNTDVRIHEEERERLRGAGLRLVDEFDALVSVLDGAREGDHTAFITQDFARLLHGWVADVQAEDLF